jgi:hypothetical protein
MVRKLCDDGISYYNEPPYTEAEEMAIYKGMDINGPVTILRAQRPSVPQTPPRKSPPPPAKR